jgi:tripartite-type tricarboxylate transporter receptor subunit TctC
MVHVRLLVAMALGATLSPAWSQDYPNKPIRLIVPLAPGGGVDILARGIASRLTETIKQPVVIDNRAGAGGSIGAEITARAAPDGYTLTMASTSHLIYSLMYKAPYDAVRDFAPVTQAVSLPLLLVSSATFPVKTVNELIAYAKQKPGSVNFGSAGSGGLPHLSGELFKIMTGTNLVHVPYKGGGAAFPDLIAGQVQLLFTAISSGTPHIKTGRLRGLAVTTKARSKSVPDIPSLDEAGVPGFDVTQWYGVLAPARTPRSIVDRLQREIAAVMQQPEFVARLAVEGTDPVASRPEKFEKDMVSELAKWRNVIRQAGIRGE